MKVIVLKQDIPIGTLEENSFGDISFTYFKEIPASQYIVGLKKEINHSNDGLFLVFKNLLPENNQIDQLKAKLKISSNIELLLHLEDIHGSYTFISEEELNNIEKPKSKKSYKYLDIKNKILQKDYPFPNILDYNLDIPTNKLFPEGIINSKVIGLSGFQYKFSVVKDDDTCTLKDDKTKLSEYFMKPYSKYYSNYSAHDKDRLYIPYLLINEHLFMTIARDVGFDVPYNAIIKDGPDYHYIIKRFDRYEGSKFDHEEFATILGYDTFTKYDPTVLELIRKASSYVNSEHVKELLLFFYFSSLISHGDLHSKNVSLIFNSNDISQQGRQISPFYDISTTQIYRGLNERDIGLKVENKKIKIRKENFLKIADLLQLDRTEFEKEMKRITDFFLNNFESYVDKLPSDIKELPFYTGNYSYHKPFETILRKYYANRKDYVKRYIDSSWVKEESIF